MCTYLSKRGATYYFRRVIPAELRPAFGGKAEFMLSLGTKDRAAAKLLIPAKTSATDRQLNAARILIAQSAPETPPQPQSRREARMDRLQWEAAQEGAEIDRIETAGKEERREELAGDVAALRQRLKGSTREMSRDDRIIKYANEAAEFESVLDRDQLLIARAGRAELPPKNTDAAPMPSSGKMLDTDVVDGWAAERKPQAKTVDAHRAVARWFYERVGRVAVADITRANALAFKAALLAEGHSPANAKVKLSRLRTLLQWAADNDLARENVAKGVAVKDTESARGKRREFDLPALQKIFSSPVFASGERPAAGKGEAAYWLPIMALYTGARLEELAQLRPADIYEQAYPDADGVERSAWVIRITEDVADNLKLKNADSERVVPVHAELERLGFLAYVAARVTAKDARLFPKLPANIYGQLGAKWGEWFGPYLRKVCGVTDKRLVFHSFRHTFKQYARHVGMPDGVQRQIMGHSSGDAAEDYGSGYPLHNVVEGMRTYRVPGLVITIAP